jgi:hypothetical protein
MSRDTNAICRQCGVFQDDVCLSWTVIEVGTVAGFDDELWRRFRMKPEHLPFDNVNRRIRDFVARHEAHGEVEFWSWDWAYGEDDPLEGLTPEGEAGKV